MILSLVYEFNLLFSKSLIPIYVSIEVTAKREFFFFFFFFVLLKLLIQKTAKRNDLCNHRLSRKAIRINQVKFA